MNKHLFLKLYQEMLDIIEQNSRKLSIPLK